MATEERRPALGQPADGEPTEGQDDFAAEHAETAVDSDVTTGGDEDRREPESPRGWSGMEEGTGSGN